MADRRRSAMPSRRFLAAALVAVAVVTVAAVMTAAPPLSAQSAPEVTFHKDVLPVLQKNCQTCHRPGQIAPMSLLTYEQARPWARAIKAKVLAREMPPWFADPEFGRFAND